MKQPSPSVSYEVPRQVMRGQQGLVLGLENDARDVATRPSINCDLFDAHALVQKDQLHRIAAPIEAKSPLHMPTSIALSHLLRLLCGSRLILQTQLGVAKPSAITLANVTPPADLLTRLPRWVANG